MDHPSIFAEATSDTVAESPSFFRPLPIGDAARRVTLLRSLGILDSPQEPSFDGLTHAAARLAGCPIALVSLLDQDRQWFKSSTGLLATETPIGSSFCSHAVLRDAFFEVEDASTDPRFAANPLVTGAPHIRFYAGQPLELDGVRLGTLCVIDTRPRKLCNDVRVALKGLASAASALIGARRSENQLLEQQRRLADIALASGDWLWESNVERRVVWSAAQQAIAPAGDFLTEGALLPDGLLLDGRGAPLLPPTTFQSLLMARNDIVRATISVDTGSGPRHLSFSAVPYRDKGGETSGFRGTARDVSGSVEHEQERYKVDLALRLDRDRAQESAKLRSELVSRVSHELRTPLNAVLGFSQILLREHGDTTFYATQIDRAATHLLALVNDMLDLARLESGLEIVDLRSVSTARVIKRCIDLLGPESRKRGVQIVATVAPGAEIVRANLRGLTQVLLNLLSNALKCSAPGLTVTVSVRSAPHGRLTIEVSDEGPGIAAELFPTLFQPFSQLSANCKKEGTGLGLSISRQLVDAMEGDLSVRSTVGKGSCFSVTLHAAEPDLSEVNESDFSNLAVPPHAAPMSESLNVLYIEDDPVNALVLDRMMAHLGNVEIHHADTAQKGKERVSSLKWDLIVLDMNLPDGHGLDVVHMLRDEVGLTYVPIVALSADALPEAIALAHAAGFDDYLTKPIDISSVERLLAGIRNHSYARQ